MTRASVPVAPPTIDIPLADAVQELTGFEALAIERRFGKKLEDLGATALMVGVVYAYENRGDGKRSWASVEAMTFRELGGYFAAPPDDADEADPDSESGKGG